jgi:hypothetical protein
VQDDIATVCKAFDDGLFVRSLKHDADDDWQMKFLGPLSALGRLAEYAAHPVTLTAPPAVPREADTDA